MSIDSGEDYANASFRGLALAGADVRGATFTDCSFDRCTLTQATFTSCSFTGCTFRTSDLSAARFPGTRFIDTRFLDGKLLGVDWTAVEQPAKLTLALTFERCRIDGAVFFGLNLRGLRLINCVARDVDFREANLSGSVCTGTDFDGARFADTDLSSADLRGAIGYAIDPRQNRIANARFSMPDAVALLAGLGVIID